MPNRMGIRWPRVPYQRIDGARLCARHSRGPPFMGRRSRVHSNVDTRYLTANIVARMQMNLHRS